jgi:hypothetical protein
LAKFLTGLIDHDPKHLTTICGTHHHANHLGLLLAWGEAPDLTWVRVNDPIDLAIVKTAVEDLASRGVNQHVAAELIGRAVAEVHTHVGTRDIQPAELIERALLRTHVGKGDLIQLD